MDLVKARALVLSGKYAKYNKAEVLSGEKALPLYLDNYEWCMSQLAKYYNGQAHEPIIDAFKQFNIYTFPQQRMFYNTATIKIYYDNDWVKFTTAGNSFMVTFPDERGE